MAIRIVRLGSSRVPGEGTRMGTVRRLPRGVPKARYAEDNWFDVWLPNLAPSADLVARAQTATTDREWLRFTKQYEREMARPETVRIVQALAALSHQANFSVGCYCSNENRCHRSVLARIFRQHRALMAI